MGLVLTVFLPLIAVIFILAFRDKKRLLPISPSSLFRFFRENWVLMIPYLLLIYGKPIYAFLDDIPRHLLTRITTRSAYHLLEWVGYRLTPSPDPYILYTKFFRARIGGACSGLDGITFFVVVFSCLLIVEEKGYSKKTIFLTYFAGIAYMLVLNILRVSAIVAAGDWTTARWGDEKGVEVFNVLFHGHFGWVTYIFGIACFFLVFFKYSKKKLAH